METRAFADTGYWIALVNPRDDLHDKASEIPRDSSFSLEDEELQAAHATITTSCKLDFGRFFSGAAPRRF